MAAWTTPTTNRAAGYQPTATDWNQTADNLKFLQYQGAMLRGNPMVTNNVDGANSVYTGVWNENVGTNPITEWKTNAGMVVQVDPTHWEFEIPAGMGGWWHFDVWAAISGWTYGAAGEWAGIGLRRRIYGGGTEDKTLRLEGPAVLMTSGRVFSASWSFFCTAGDRIVPLVYQASGLTLRATSWLHGQWMSGGSGTRPTWANLATPTVGSMVNSTIWNNVQGNLKWLHDRPFCWVKRSGTWTSPNNVALLIDFNSADTYDASAMHDPAGAEAWAINAPYDGVYLVDALLVAPAASLGGRREVRYYKMTARSGGVWASTGTSTPWPGGMGGLVQVNTSSNSVIWATGYVTLRAGDRLGLSFFQDSGVDITMVSAEAQITYLGMTRNSPWGDQLGLAPGPRRPT
jgi:hypothetical protein